MLSLNTCPSWRRSFSRIAFTGLVGFAVLVAACGDEPDVASTPDPTATPSPTVGVGAEPPDIEGTGTASATPETSEPPDAQQRLRAHLLSSLVTLTDPAAARVALESVDVIAVPFPSDARDLWVAVTSGAGIWELPDERTHVAAIYELRSDDTWVEVSSLPLASAPTVADIEIALGSHAGSAWFAVHGVTGAHSGTFELLQFDGITLASVLWWFSPSPGAGSLIDLDADGVPEVVLDTTDPYVYCYACGVRLWGEVIYRWDGATLMEVPLSSVPHANQIVTDLTEQAAIFARADLWRRAAEAASAAAEAAPDDDEVTWLHLAISRMADARLIEGGSEAQPLLTWVLAGEYDAAVSLMRTLAPGDVFTASGPLISGTAAEGGWEQVTGDYLVDFASRALEVESDLASAYAVRALGRILADPDDWSGALLDMEAALALTPADAFYAEAVDYLRAQDAGSSG
ncbi:MAG: hypothetical protein WD942_06975 [Dehalococcoidia bacterium]